jgi:uncharacterized protein (TIGR02246 family)
VTWWAKVPPTFARAAAMLRGSESRDLRVATLYGTWIGHTEAWNAHSAEAVASFHAEDSRIVINDGKPWEGRAGVAEMARGFLADVPDLVLRCDGVRTAGHHVVYLWTFEGHAAGTGARLTVAGWEEWTFRPDGKLSSSLGWFDAEDYQRQVDAI